jgi:ABC-type transport system involved in cytochrome c biogenesis permease component
MVEELGFTQRFERRLFNQRLVLAFHCVAALSTAFVYLSQLHLHRFPYWSRVGFALSFLLIPPLLPYVISGVHAWRNMTEDRLRVALFLLVLVAGTVGVCSALFGAFGLKELARVFQTGR